MRRTCGHDGLGLRHVERDNNIEGRWESIRHRRGATRSIAVQLSFTSLFRALPQFLSHVHVLSRWFGLCDHFALPLIIRPMSVCLI